MKSRNQREGRYVGCANGFYVRDRYWPLKQLSSNVSKITLRKRFAAALKRNPDDLLEIITRNFGLGRFTIGLKDFKRNHGKAAINGKIS